MRHAPIGDRAAAGVLAAAPWRIAGLLLAAGGLAGGCFGLGGGTAPGTPYLRPAVQRLGQHQVVGNAVVASLAGVAISLEPLTPDQLDAFYQNRPGLVNPLKGLTGGDPPPIAFRVIVRNRGRQAVQIEPATFLLTDQDEQRVRPMDYQHFYQTLADVPDAEIRLRSFQATTLSNFFSVPPGGEREGFIFFPPPLQSSRLLVLELASLYFGAREMPLLAEFEVVRSRAGSR